MLAINTTEANSFLLTIATTTNTLRAKTPTTRVTRVADPHIMQAKEATSQPSTLLSQRLQTTSSLAGTQTGSSLKEVRTLVLMT
jgi:hypothetical protein